MSHRTNRNCTKATCRSTTTTLVLTRKQAKLSASPVQEVELRGRELPAPPRGWRLSHATLGLSPLALRRIGVRRRVARRDDRSPSFSPPLAFLKLLVVVGKIRTRIVSRRLQRLRESSRNAGALAVAAGAGAAPWIFSASYNIISKRKGLAAR